MWVVKIGGSLWDSGRLSGCLEQLGDADAPVVVVPGGGPFADQVRRAQARWCFDDLTAHRMAILAMDQMALMLAALHPRLVVAADVASLDSAMRKGLIPVWQPSRMLQQQPDIAASWRVTSDSLAAWLAGQLRADGLVLIKSAALGAAGDSIASLQRRSVLDEAFDAFSVTLECPVWLINRDSVAALPQIIEGQGDGEVGVRLAG